LISGRNILEMAHETGISAATLYAGRARLISERNARQEAETDATRLGSARRLATLAGEVRRARHDATSSGNPRLAKDLAEVERKIIGDITNLSPELEQDEEAKEAMALSEAAIAIIHQVRTQQVITIALESLRANNASPKLIRAIEQFTPKDAR
jgi:hypothetical protein